MKRIMYVHILSIKDLFISPRTPEKVELLSCGKLCSVLSSGKCGALPGNESSDLN